MSTLASKRSFAASGALPAPNTLISGPVFNEASNGAYSADASQQTTYRIEATSGTRPASLVLDGFTDSAPSDWMAYIGWQPDGSRLGMDMNVGGGTVVFYNVDASGTHTLNGAAVTGLSASVNQYLRVKLDWNADGSITGTVWASTDYSLMGQDIARIMAPTTRSGAAVSATTGKAGFLGRGTHLLGYDYTDATAPSDTTPPSLTGSISITAVTTTSFTATCPVATDNVAVVGYQYNLDGAGWIDISAGGRSSTFSGLLPGSTHTVQMRAKDAVPLYSSALSASQTLPTGSDTTDPTLGGVVSVSSITSTSATISWPAGADNVGVTGYEYSLNGGAYVDVANVLNKPLIGLTPSTAYAVSVRCYDAAGNRSAPITTTSPFTTSPASGSGSITSPVVKNWGDGQVLASLAIPVLTVSRLSDGVQVLRLTGQATNSSGRIVIPANVALAQGTDYMLAAWDANGDGMLHKVTAT